jgi:hypothetical protein
MPPQRAFAGGVRQASSYLLRRYGAMDTLLLLWGYRRTSVMGTGHDTLLLHGGGTGHASVTRGRDGARSMCSNGSSIRTSPATGHPDASPSRNL